MSRSSLFMCRSRGLRAPRSFPTRRSSDLQRLRLVKRGDCVVDLGAAPGSWSQVLIELVGPSGRLVAIDLAPIEPLRSEEHTSELQSRFDLVCRLRLEKKHAPAHRVTIAGR